MPIDKQPLVEGAGKLAPAKCPLPGCGAVLVVTTHACRAIHLGDTAEDLRTGGAETYSWEIGCTEGHVILLPPGTGQDDYDFGRCTCSPGDTPEDMQLCEHNDAARLRALLALTAADSHA